VEADALHERSARARRADEAPENPLERRLRRTWDRITGVR
jgi:hypothetical protein